MNVQKLPSHPRFVIAAVIAASFGCAGNVERPPASRGEAAVGPPAVMGLDGAPYDLRVGSEALVTVVVFTRTDCPIANRFAPEIRRLHESYLGRGARFCLVYADPQDQPDAVRRHLQEYGYSCTGLRDPAHALVRYCQATRTPEAVVFDQKWNIAYRGRIDDSFPELGGARSAPSSHDLADAIEATLAGRAPANRVTQVVGCPIEGIRP